jgi:hypothetical protein
LLPSNSKAPVARVLKAWSLPASITISMTLLLASRLFAEIARV